MMYRTVVGLALLSAVALARGGHHHGRGGVPACGVPDYINELPEAMKTKVEAIWKDWKEESPCFEQQKKTRVLIHELPKDVRHKLFRHVPSFLRGASEDVKTKFRTVHRDIGLTREEKREKTKELAKKLLNKEQLKKFNAFEADWEKRHAVHQKKVDGLSKAARALYDDLEALREKKHKLIAAAPEAVAQEIKEAFGWRFMH